MDYSSFSSVAKSRFRPVAKELGFEQVSGTIYQRKRNDWIEGFNLQASSGNTFFYVNYGVIIPNLWEPFKTEIDSESLGGYTLHRRLNSGKGSGFDRATKDQVKQSAELVLRKFKEQAEPWFSSISDMRDIAERDLLSSGIKKSDIGKLNYFQQLGVASYGFLLAKAGDAENALKWLLEADRLFSLPLYSAKDGRWVHEKEKGARLMKPQDYEVEQHQQIKAAIQELKTPNKAKQAGTR
ncbi:DUF4304 domain-containing protein [Alcanivorax sp.]|uniref:DUF4304 domain-containing protein n=1 Tax=Alcanivorax sp. TaxID=1872427 RepID=UPI0025B7EA7C|nr:DUF4304 domain-containing protein [Alcanivorax sp.]